MSIRSRIVALVAAALLAAPVPRASADGIHGAPIPAGSIQCAGTGGGGTVTFSNGSPLITWTGHGLTAAANNYAAVNFTTTGSLPTGFSVGTNYYLVVVDANTIEVASSVANAIAGTFISAGSAGSGTQSASLSAVLSNGVTQDICGLLLPPGHWLLFGTQKILLSTATASMVEGAVSGNSGSLGNSRWSSYLDLTAASTNIQHNSFPVYVQATTTTTKFCDAYASFSAGAVSAYGTCYAVRVP